MPLLFDLIPVLDFQPDMSSFSRFGSILLNISYGNGIPDGWGCNSPETTYDSTQLRLFGEHFV